MPPGHTLLIQPYSYCTVTQTLCFSQTCGFTVSNTCHAYSLLQDLIVSLHLLRMTLCIVSAFPNNIHLGCLSILCGTSPVDSSLQNFTLASCGILDICSHTLLYFVDVFHLSILWLLKRLKAIREQGLYISGWVGFLHMLLIPESVVVSVEHSMLFVSMFVFLIHHVFLVAPNIYIVSGISMNIRFNLKRLFDSLSHRFITIIHFTSFQLWCNIFFPQDKCW